MTEINVDSGLGFAQPVIDVNTQNAIKEPKHKILHQFGQPTVISSDQGTCFTVFTIDDIQDTLLQNMGPWHIDYLKLKQFEKTAEARGSL